MGLASSALSQATQDLLEISIFGETRGAAPRDNPQKALADPEIQRLMLDVAAQPRDAPLIESALRGKPLTATDLARLGLLVKEGGFYVLGFPLFTTTDLALLRSVSERFGRELRHGTSRDAQNSRPSSTAIRCAMSIASRLPFC